MAENKFKVEQPNGEKKQGFFGFLSSKLKIEEIESGFPFRYLPKVLFAVAIGVIYVWNNHYAEKATRTIDKLEDEVEDLRADVTTLEADYMFSSKQSEVARNVESLGLQESKEPPIKIVVDEDEY
jgi:outer membrane murein-binding lipoprotein Lpp